MKKYILIGGFLISLLAIGVLVRNRVPQEAGDSPQTQVTGGQTQEASKPEQGASSGDISQEKIQESLESNSISGRDETEAESTSMQELSKMDEEELDEMEDLYAYAEKEWGEISKKLFLSDLDLSQDEYEQYQSMREDFEEERWRAFEDFHEEMLENPNDEVNATEYTDKVEQEMTQQYEDELRDLIGDQNFKVYLQKRQEFNEKLREKQDPRKGMLLIQL